MSETGCCDCRGNQKNDKQLTGCIVCCYKCCSFLLAQDYPFLFATINLSVLVFVLTTPVRVNDSICKNLLICLLLHHIIEISAGLQTFSPLNCCTFIDCLGIMGPQKAGGKKLKLCRCSASQRIYLFLKAQQIIIWNFNLINELLRFFDKEINRIDFLLGVSLTASMLGSIVYSCCLTSGQGLHKSRDDTNKDD
ncbi:MAG: hypothetical protein MHMPM18_002354 [Marteilia pararefringens]